MFVFGLGGGEKHERGVAGIEQDVAVGSSERFLFKKGSPPIRRQKKQVGTKRWSFVRRVCRLPYSWVGELRQS